jgi:predicted RND superfamily exporter protein
MINSEQQMSGFFYRITTHPRLALGIALLAIAVASTGLTKLVKDTSVKAFIPSDHPALIADQKATDIFGLSDTIAIAVTTTGATVFEADTLEVVSRLTDAVASLPNIRPDRVVSLATESSISGHDGEILVTPYIGQQPFYSEDINAARRQWQAMPPHIGTLVSEDETSAIVMAEIIDSHIADETYRSVLEVIAGIDTDALKVHVAGPGAVSGYLSRYIDKDARKLQPLVFLLVLGFIYFAFRRLGGLPGPLLVVFGAVGGALGIMAWNGVPYYAITNALPVIIVAISVADSIHILSAYFQLRAQHPESSTRSLVVRAMSTMTRPITLTTMTTIAGFVGIGLVSIMPPITAFAWYAALGVFLAWVFSLLALPNMLVLLNLGPSPAFENWRKNKPSGLGRFLAHIGAFSARNYPLVLGLFAVVTVIAVNGAVQLKVDRSQVDNFAPDEPIRIADETINDTFSGTAFLDIVIETSEPEGLLDPENMARIAALQGFMETLPHVRKTVSITDYLSLLHHSIEEHSPAAVRERQLPLDPDGIAQYLLVYEMSGDPTDFEEEIDYDYQTALVRGILDSHYFSESRIAVEALQEYIDTEFNSESIVASLAGDVAISYHWMSRLEQSHFVGIILSLVLVLVTSMLVFRSITGGFIAVVPVTFSVTVLYAVMGYLGIYLEPATSMFAAIALGVGVDFGIHLVEKLREARVIHADDTAAAVNEALPSTARACFFNSAALGLGFAVLMVSSLPTLQRFGGLVAVAAVSSYVAALIIVPAMFAAEHEMWRRLAAPSRRLIARATALLVLVAGSALFANRASANEFSALDIAQRVSDRPEGRATHRTIDIELTNKRGRSKARQALVIKETQNDARVTRITYTEPASIRGTSFLSHDFHDPSQANRSWFYMPSLRKVRRVPASDRGDYFLGTDFTYEDIQSDLKFDLADYTFAYHGTSVADGATRHHLTGIPVSPTTARQLGYGAFSAIVDEKTWMPISVEFLDLDQEPLKTIDVMRIEQVDEIWTATEIRALNHQTGHQTHFAFRDISYVDDLSDQMFEPPALSRGLPILVAGASE